MGYREAAAGLPANLQLLLYRQYIYDGTWYKTPTLGWIEFTVGKLKPYEEHRANTNAGSCRALVAVPGSIGVVKASSTIPNRPRMVAKVGLTGSTGIVPILTSDIIHLARPSGRDIDAIFHVNPQLDQRGLAVLFNPLDQPVKKDIELPLHGHGY